MNYELAKELKDAGFPQTGKGEVLQNHLSRRPITTHYLVDEAYAPTLEELIEACTALIPEDENVQVYCFKKEATAWTRKGHTHVGKTPTEAVARLWLALNKKSAPKPLHDNKDV